MRLLDLAARWAAANERRLIGLFCRLAADPAWFCIVHGTAELLVGGVTRALLSSMMVPVLMSR